MFIRKPGSLIEHRVKKNRVNKAKAKLLMISPGSSPIKLSTNNFTNEDEEDLDCVKVKEENEKEVQSSPVLLYLLDWSSKHKELRFSVFLLQKLNLSNTY